MNYDSGPENQLVLMRGAGDLASGVAWRLHRCGFPVVMTELAAPLVVRRTVSFAEAAFAGQAAVEGVVAQRAADVAEARRLLAAGVIPLLIDPAATCRAELHPAVMVDAIMAKVNTGTAIDDAPLVAALGPGFTAGIDCHAVIETNRGHDLGRVIWQGAAEPDTKTPGEVGGYKGARVLRAPADGQVHAHVAIGDAVQEGQVLAHIDGAPIVAPFAGVLRGIVHPSVSVYTGMKIGDLDARAERRYCFTISEKSLAVAGGVLEAILTRLAAARRMEFAG
ncbi:MAG TPA: selenium-dependent molybdenum cofactor biosynthesis protein YqeB [Anaerolineae bacterium]|nr:selenium-dependent molybdenum cofactor biosynthesis protein YqeB [Anaerolineae bacterium]HNU03548.1 selenium-dependent molybdenum cofactor biosynthesis protein YqeB [Anaerolineae bacterium]HNU05373.1 selenium-dependent molybdenum cofactor biosynthesis protein YqeB [Anaerolineae bacterium]